MCLFITLCSTTLSVASIANFIPEPPKCTKTEYGKVKGNDFTANITRFSTGYYAGKPFCYTQARMAFAPDGRGIFVMSALHLSGMDVYSGLFFATTKNFGKHWSEFKASETIKRRDTGDCQSMLVDASPHYHKASDKFIIFGTETLYSKKTGKKDSGKSRTALYSIFEEAKNEWTIPNSVLLGKGNFGVGCVQAFVEEDGSIYLPISRLDKTKKKIHTVFVAKCKFDGTKITVEKIGNNMSVDFGRGLYEPSIIKSGGTYFLSLRNDFDGYITKSKDGLNFETPKKLFFDNGSIVGNYNTQTHFLGNVGKVYLVYTRKGANNDHVFRHRAPLFVAQVNEDSLTLKKSTERTIIPERGARLGNFGCSKLSEGKWVVVAAEWMQGAKKWQGCMKYGSDNSIFATEIEFNK